MKISRVSAAATAAAAAVAVPSSASAQVAQVTIRGTRSIPCCGVTISLDSYMSSFFGSSSYYSGGFDQPEGEAYAFNWGKWLTKPITPSAAMTLDACSMSRDGGARLITKDSLPLERAAAATAMYFQNLPNFINTRKEGLILAVIFGDGSQEQYRHSTTGQLIPMSDTFIPGTGISGSHCTG